ncbi:MAG: serine protease [Betaproteobacteria bacterium]
MPKPAQRCLSWWRALWPLLLVLAAPVARADLSQTIERIKPSVVGVGTFLKLRSPSNVFVGTGFVVADGRHVITNAHNVDRPLDIDKKESPIVLVSRGGEPQPRDAVIVAVDKLHDIALLRFSGEPMPALKIGDSGMVREGRMMAFTGFPIGMVLGFHPVTHRGMVSAITPVVMPGINASQLNAAMIARLRESAYMVFQLDGTAYPGNSGSAVFDPEDGTVYGIVNSTFVQGTRENAVGRPSGITYAIPGKYIREMLLKEKVPGFE